MGKRVILTRKPFVPLAIGCISSGRNTAGIMVNCPQRSQRAFRATGTHCYVVTDDDGNDHGVIHTRDMVVTDLEQK
jgi:hypothetical protein